MKIILSRESKEKLNTLSTSDCSTAALAAVRNLVTTGSDMDCYKVNPFRMADQNGIERVQMLRALLFATRLGIFDLNWDIHCPSCTGVPVYHKHLMGLTRTAHCDLCEIDWELDFESQVEVTFTVNPDVRKVSYPEWHERDMWEKLKLMSEMETRENRASEIGICIYPDKSYEREIELTSGSYFIYIPGKMEGKKTIRVSGQRRADQKLLVTVREDSTISLEGDEFYSGKAKILIENRLPALDGFILIKDRQWDNWVSAAYVSAQQDFRDLFAGEFLSPDTSFAIRSLTFLFTDIKGSTGMYEAKGDSRAFTLVKEHFSRMTGIIKALEGGIVKTIGDAVMAAFPVNLNAVRAAVAIQEVFETSGADIRVKIGLHRGPTIAVTSNRNLDYFGRTVNIASRVQGHSSAGEILMTEQVSSEKAVKRFLTTLPGKLCRRYANLKGIQGRMRLVSLFPVAPFPPASGFQSSVSRLQRQF
ncbi:MAG: DUF5939 domain-containing protein [Candidatus Wallbacteria bacterium]|nr:DUF5939 domain-containing protein [Candidatus Wallbacteria bacterium]